MAYLPNTDDVEDRSEYPVIPKGAYKAVIEQSVQEESKNGFPMLKVEAVIIEGPHEGHKLVDRFLLDHENEQAKNIGLRKLKQLKLAVGKPQARDESELWDVPVLMLVGMEESKSGEFPNKNRINGFKPLGGEVVKPATIATATPPVHTGGSESPKRSWRK